MSERAKRAAEVLASLGWQIEPCGDEHVCQRCGTEVATADRYCRQCGERQPMRFAPSGLADLEAAIDAAIAPPKEQP